MDYANIYVDDYFTKFPEYYLLSWELHTAVMICTSLLNISKAGKNPFHADCMNSEKEITTHLQLSWHLKAAFTY